MIMNIAVKALRTICALFQCRHLRPYLAISIAAGARMSVANEPNTAGEGGVKVRFDGSEISTGSLPSWLFIPLSYI